MIPEITPSENTSYAYKNFAPTIKVIVAVFSVLLITSIVVLFLLNRPTAGFPVDSSVQIKPGQSVSQIVGTFKKAGYVRSENLLHAALVFQKATTDIKAGTYHFTKPLSTLAVAKLIIEVGPTDPLLTLTFPEGLPTVAFAEIASNKLKHFNETDFLLLAKAFEGRLFPDTYYVPETYTEEALFDLLIETHTQKLAPLQAQIEEHPLTEEEIIILASIIEREANSEESMKLVSSVLQNRLKINMALQADASIEYVLGKPLAELTADDLKVDSPYNTYLNPGLPPTPIGNPGLTAIKAVLEPADSEYFYYITDDNGGFHFAETFAKHKQNIARYLR